MQLKSWRLEAFQSWWLLSFSSGGHDKSTGLMNSCYFWGVFAVSHRHATEMVIWDTRVLKLLYSPVDQHGSIVPLHERKLSMDDGKQ